MNNLQIELAKNICDNLEQSEICIVVTNFTDLWLTSHSNRTY